MNSEWWTYGGIIGGTITVIIYLVRARLNRVEVEMGDFVILFLATMGILAGVRVCIMCFTSQCPDLVGENLVYYFLGGICVIYVSWITIRSTLLQNAQNPRA